MKTPGLDAKRLAAEKRLPLLVSPSSGETDLPSLARGNRGAIEGWLREYGAILFRGFAVPTSAQFAQAVDALTDRRLDYVYRSTPRTAVGDRIFTATIYPPALEIPMHQENAYQRDWPMRVCFYCAHAARVGGETPIADMRQVTARIAPRLLDALETRGVKYIRHYRPGVDLPWQEVFQTEDKEALARFCTDHGVDHAWLAPDLLRTAQVCQGTSIHPETRERLFFNQAHLFHVSHLGTDVAEAMMKMFGADRLPRHAAYGDGTPIADDDLAQIRAAFAAEAVAFPWQEGDVLLIDNMLVAHGRRPFSGKREVLAALSDPYSTWAERRPATAVG